MSITIKLHAEAETVTPKDAEKQNKYCNGFADTVTKTKKEATAPWGWCTVVVTAEYTHNKKVYMGTATIGLCSYLNELDFVYNSGYYTDLVKEALDDLKKQLGEFSVDVPVCDNTTQMIGELCTLMANKGNSKSTIMVARLQKSLTGKRDMLYKFATACWEGCMCNPTSISKLSIEERQRAKDIMAELEKLKV